MKKWVNVKDSWLRYNRKNNGNQKSVPGTKYSRKYVYNDALQFLKKNYSYFGEQDTSKGFPDKKPSQKTATNETTARECKSSVTEQVKTLNTEPKKRKRKRDAERSRLSEDRHLSFFRGILPSLTHLSEDEVLQFQVGVMSVLKGIKDAKRNPTMSYHSQHSAMPSLMWNALSPIPPNILGYPGNYIPHYHDVLSSSTSKDNAAFHHSVYQSSNHGGANTTHVANTSCSGLDEDQIDLESTESSFVEESISSDSSSTPLVKLEKSVIVPQEK